MNKNSTTSTLLIAGPITMQTAQWKICHDLTVNLDDIRRSLPRLAARLTTIPDELILFFWASSARFAIKYEVLGEDDMETVPGGIHDLSGKWVGSLNVDIDEEWFSWISPGDSPDLEEFIVVGSRRYLAERPSLDVMLIKWGKGIAYRMCMGTVGEAAWVQAQPTWKLIALG